MPRILADFSQMLQLFQNLIANAVKYRRPDAPCVVDVMARRGEHEWIFSVKDNGIGIRSEDVDRIFLIFQRLHTRQEYPGTGIGLAICRRIVGFYGGRIWVESQVGQGSEFLFSISDR